MNWDEFKQRYREAQDENSKKSLLNELYLELFPILVTYISSYGFHIEDSEDIAQSVLIRISTNIDVLTTKNYQNFVVFSKTLARMNIIDKIRKDKKLKISESVNPEQIGVSDGDPEKLFIDSEEPSISLRKDEINILLELIDNTICVIEDTNDGNLSNNNLALSYLKDIRDEIKSGKPKWKKIVNGLVVVMALVSGTAAAPMAMDNIDKAINIVVEKTESTVDLSILRRIVNDSTSVKKP